MLFHAASFLRLSECKIEKCVTDMCLMCAKICHLSCMSYSLLVRNTWDIHINIGNSIVHDDKEIMMRSPNFEAGPCMRNGE